jgi:hypothetical protein
MRPEFPTSLDKLLLWALPKERLENRMKIYRIMVRDYLHTKYGRLPTDEEVAAEIHAIRQKKFGEYESETLAALIRNNAAIIKMGNLKIRAKAGAAARWKKKKRL